MPGTWGEKEVFRLLEVRGEAGQGPWPQPLQPEVSPWWCTKGCIRRNRSHNEHRCNLKKESPPMILPDCPCEPSLTLPITGRWRRRQIIFFHLCSVPVSLALKWLVCQMAKHLQLECIRLIKETLSSKRWEVCHLLRSDSSENGCLAFPGSVYDSCQAMLGLSNHPAGDHIIELILSINIDNNKRD